MSVVPGGVDTDQQPPMTVPLRHFLVALAFLLLGAVVGLADAAGVQVGNSELAHVHLLLVGWICVTIMGAMTQFVPVWSGVSLHSRRLAVWQLWLVAGGLTAFAGALTASRYDLLPIAGLAMLTGLCVFAYNIARTLPPIGGLDRTERHFAFALGCFVLVATLGVLLALGFTRPVFHEFGIGRTNAVGAHVTLAVFGAILATVLGALYQLGTMFTQTELHGVDHWLARFEDVAYPAGVLALALGRLLGAELLATAGGLLVAAGIATVAAILARKLLEMRGPWTPMHRRYAVAVLAMGLWSALAVPTFVAEPLAHASAFGAPGTVHLLTLGAIGFVVFGTLYHVVPFVVWVHHYADLLGYEPVPMIDDLYDDRLAHLDLGLLVAGTTAIVAWDWFGTSSVVGAVGGALVAPTGGALVAAGCVAFVANVVLVLRRHSPQSLPVILFGPGVVGAGGSTESGSSAATKQPSAERSTTPGDGDGQAVTDADE